MILKYLKHCTSRRTMHLITLHFDNEIDILTLLTDFSLRKYEIIDSNN